MERAFEYMKVQTALDTFNVEDIGNTILQANNDDGLEWYLSICTNTGWSEIKEFGPMYGTNETIVKNGFSYYHHREEYNEKRLCKAINTFLNNPSRVITQVQEISESELASKIEMIKNLL